MKKLHYILIFVFLFPLVNNAQTEVYENALEELSDMLVGKRDKSFKRAVYLVENAYHDNFLDSTAFENEISILKNLANRLIESRTLKYDGKDVEKVEKYAAVFSVLKDTIKVQNAEGKLFKYVPYGYDFKDVWGHQDWSNMFVSKLLSTGKGNCHSLPYLYKILAEEIGGDAHLALAPNHVYIKHKNEKDGWYNTELTSGIFPIDAWLMASGYIHLDAITNKLYMEALDENQSLAMCIIDLAQGYERKFPGNDGTFVLKSTELALEYYPHYINALIMRAETKKKILEAEASKKYTSLNDAVHKDKEIQLSFVDLQKEYVNIHNLGYRKMPEKMYLDWLTSLERERKKYENTDITKNN